MAEFSPAELSDWRGSADLAESIRDEVEAHTDPGALIECICAATKRAASLQRKEQMVALYDEAGDPPHGVKLRRLCMVIAIEDAGIFNALFNGRCGYRAMYWQCADLGERFNETIVAAIVKTISEDKAFMAGPIAQAAAWCSLRHAHTKLWPAFERRFLSTGTLDVKRWKDAAAGGERLFDPAYPVLALKGVFLDAEGNSHATKPTRSADLHERGLT